jgi:hypothetical protein
MGGEFFLSFSKGHSVRKISDRILKKVAIFTEGRAVLDKGDVSVSVSQLTESGQLLKSAV